MSPGRVSLAAAALLALGGAPYGAHAVETGCHVPRPPACLARGWRFDRAAEVARCEEAVLRYGQRLQVLARCDPDLAAEATARSVRALRRLRDQTRGVPRQNLGGD